MFDITLHVLFKMLKKKEKVGGDYSEERRYLMMLKFVLLRKCDALSSTSIHRSMHNYRLCILDLLFTGMKKTPSS